jgi:hypothetical protein
MSRVLALIGAVCLIAAAILARALLTGDGDDGDGGGGDGGDALVVACIPELEAACRAIDRDVELSIEDPAVTIGRLADGEDIDAWVTLDPWPAMAAIVEPRAVAEPVEPVASDELVLLARTNTAEGTGCDDPLTWSCLVDALGDSVAVPEPTAGLGVLILGQAATDFFGGTFAANDFGQPQLADRFALLEVDDDAFEDMRVGLPEPAATGVLDLDLDSLGVRRGDFTASTSAAPVTVAVVVAGPRADRVAGEPGFTTALEDAGWTLDPDAATTGLPNAGVLVALQGAVG